MTWPTALSIAGSDCSGGAGIQADLKTFQDHRVFGMTAIVALTAQNTRGVTWVEPVPLIGVRAQLDAIFDDIAVSAIKVGMLGTARVAQTVVDTLRERASGIPIVIDPVLIASTGQRLLDTDAIAIVRDGLLPLATLATPNADEARVLAGEGSMDAAAWAGTAPCPILVTGGDREGDTISDTLYRRDGSSRSWTRPRIGTRPVHGTGCTLSSAIAARLAHDAPLEDAIEGATDYVRRLLAAPAGTIGAGQAVLGHGLG